MNYSKLPCVLAAVAMFALSLSARDVGNVIPFQGQLADQSGQPLTPASPVTIVFRLYQTPVGGAAFWEEAQPNISVNAGRFSVLLGSRSPLPGYTNFNATLYLGLTVDDGDPQTTDVEMRPRQALLPVISASYAKQAQNSDTLGGFDWSALFGVNDPQGDVLGSRIAPGTVTAIQISPQTIGSAQIASGAVEDRHIGTLSRLEFLDGNRRIGFNTPIGDLPLGGIVSLSRSQDGAKSFYLGGTANPRSDFVLYVQGGGSEMSFVSAGVSSEGFGFYINSDLPTAFGASRPIPAVKIRGNGNVGIGYFQSTVPQPATLLHLLGQDPVLRVQQNPWSPGTAAVRLSAAGSGTNKAQLILQGTTLESSTASAHLRIFNLVNELAYFDSSGYVGIGTTSPTFRLHVNGSAGKPGGGSWSTASDERLKQDIEPIHGALDRMLQLQGTTFRFKDPASICELSGRQTGMVAQDVEKVFPGWVDEGADGYKRVTYRGFEALTVEAFRDLRVEKDAQIAELTKRVKGLEDRLAALERMITGMAAQRTGPGQ